MCPGFDDCFALLRFHTEALNELLESDDKFGFIVMDGNGSLFGTVAGNHREVRHYITLPLLPLVTHSDEDPVLRLPPAPHTPALYHLLFSH